MCHQFIFVIIGIGFLDQLFAFQEETNLRKEKLQNYDLFVAPSTPTDVSVLLNIYKVTKLSIADSSLAFNGWITLEWVDERLAWKSDPRYANVTQTHYKASPYGTNLDSIWTPDIELYNFFDSPYAFNEKPAVVYPSGYIWWAPVGMYNAICSYENVEYFPFDKPICVLDFGGWTLSGLYVNYKPGKILFQDTSAVGYEFSPFGIDYDNAKVTVQNFYYNCCPDEPWPIVSFEIPLIRSARFYVISIIIPNICLTYISFAILTCHVSCGERVGVGATMILALSAIDFIASAFIPKSNKWLWINYLTMLSILFCVLSLLESCVITRHYYNTREVDNFYWKRALSFWNTICDSCTKIQPGKVYATHGKVYECFEENPKENDEINKKTVTIVEKDSVNLSDEDEDEGESIANLEKMQHLHKLRSRRNRRGTTRLEKVVLDSLISTQRVTKETKEEKVEREEEEQEEAIYLKIDAFCRRALFYSYTICLLILFIDLLSQ